MERHLEETLVSQGVPLDQLLAALPGWLEENNAEAHNSETITLINNITDYTAFRDMMILARKGHMVRPPGFSAQPGNGESAALDGRSVPPGV